MLNALETLRGQLIEQEMPTDKIEQELEAAEVQIATLITEHTHLLNAQWRRDHPGRQPTFPELQKLHKRARMMGEEVFLAQLTEMPTDREEPEPELQQSRTTNWWLDETLEPSEQMQELADLLWPDRTVRFRVWAADLLEARRLDHLPVPSSPQDALAGDVADEVDRVLMTISSQSST
ncbi:MULTISPECIES: hypothetical protein [Gordonia]|uniref:Uncharacterized protein n=1 Tax=Gordonia sihwensis NBRC 108236 TaxID=1223544 RepID=L7LMF7_9ACTN|nr:MULTISPECIES: hypothetical protein [Gordonia]AUH70536.1 hypothetical protein CXX93_19125 [Gordonia sp. YC-JH1]WFN95108.1 hypothetical protein P5P27_20250 [Gordonia sihwensis]GAC62325.1 hypothetical protein GSI01S_33_00110 [Gordonia sihwensis NBRC 108236]